METSQVTKTLKLYTPHSKQLEFHNSKARYRVVGFGRQSGKSTACNNELLKKAWENKNSVYWFISPTHDGAKIMFFRALAALGRVPDIYSDNKSDLLITLENGSKIFYKSGEVFENLRSETLHGVVIDEVRNQRAELWNLVIRPMLTTTKGWAAFISTPNGFDHFYDLYMHAKSDDSGQWAAFQAPSTCNPLITTEELEEARRTMTEAEFAQEYLAEFRSLTANKAYLCYGDHNYSHKNPFWADGPVHPMLPIIVGPDFNLGRMCWTLLQKRVDHFHAFDEIHLQGVDGHTQRASEVLCQKIIELGHQKAGVIIAGDATAKAGQRAAFGQSDYDIIKQTLDNHGITWTDATPDSNPKVIDRVNTMNAHLKAGDGTVRFTLNPKQCPNLAKDFDRVNWKVSGSGAAVLDQTTNPDLTHQSDGCSYALVALSPIRYNSGSASIKVVRR